MHSAVTGSAPRASRANSAVTPLSAAMIGTTAAVLPSRIMAPAFSLEALRFEVLVALRVDVVVGTAIGLWRTRRRSTWRRGGRLGLFRLGLFGLEASRRLGRIALHRLLNRRRNGVYWRGIDRIHCGRRSDFGRCFARCRKWAGRWRTCVRIAGSRRFAPRQQDTDGDARDRQTGEAHTETEPPARRCLDPYASVQRAELRRDRRRTHPGGRRRRSLERVRECLHRRKPPPLVFLERALQDRRHGRRNRTVRIDEMPRLLVNDLVDDARNALAAEGGLTRQHLVDDQRQGELIGPRVDLLDAPERLLG